MRSRRFRKRIEIYETTAVSDGVGGNTVTSALLGTSWADLRSVNKKTDLSQFGINNTQLAIEVTVRKRNDLAYNSINQFIVYGGENYNIVSFPTNTNFDNSLITFIAVKQQTKSV